MRIDKTENVKQVALQLIRQLPDDANWEKVLYTLQVRSDLAFGLADIEAGRLVDGEEVMEWIDSWGMDNEKEPPLEIDGRIDGIRHD